MVSDATSVPPSVSGLAGKTTELEVAAVAALSARATCQPAQPCHCLHAAWEPGSDPGPWAGQVTALP